MSTKRNKLDELKELLCDYGYEDTIVFDNPDFADACIGVTESGRAVYDYDLMVQSLMQEDGVSMMDAIEFIEVNTIGALPYTEDSPIILYRMEELPLTGEKK